ncbi:RNA polymerase sigma factor [Collinsella phocaeensis]|uniref:RNA polymerase sigma factor n=1 Tax=Collinsella phocaeensis TaxID=1871016 RepID=UPI0009FAA227|nr:RNA polymerase sigma factor [Collinsella phocaeensis]
MRRKPLHSGVAARPDVFMEHTVERHRGAVIQLALARTRSAADAQDIAQEVFIKLLRSTARFHDDDHLRAWLLRATHDSCVDLHRQAWRRRVETREDMGAVADRATMDPAIEEVMDHPVWTAMGRLPDKLRCALHLHYVEGYGIAEVAGILGCTEAAARTRLHRGRKKLAAEIARLEAAGPAPAPARRTAADPNDPTYPATQQTAR